jgi:hypothetical protein
VARLQPESPLRWLDSLDALTGAARLYCAGYGGARLLLLLLGLLLALLAGHALPG